MYASEGSHDRFLHRLCIACQINPTILSKVKKEQDILNISDLWRKEWDSNPRYTKMYNGFRDRHNRPLCHPSGP